jgi:transcriptional regulator with GAF, ATPase, and Fis domain
MFGHEMDAFTGATSQKKGRVELAHQGSLFLDEGGDLPPEIQTKLLRVLQEQEFERVGGEQTIKVDVRVIAATNRDLEKEVAAGRFRTDLFYRLNIFPIQIPPLRDRKEDIFLLAEYLVRQISKRLGKPIEKVSPAVIHKLTRSNWPGNVRELANILERAVILCQGGVIRKQHIGSLSTAPVVDDTFPTLQEVERRHILKALEKTGGVLSGPNGAAALLQLHRSTLWSRMQKLGIRVSKTVSR